jgi:hypothetical protein
LDLASPVPPAPDDLYLALLKARVGESQAYLEALTVRGRAAADPNRSRKVPTRGRGFGAWVTYRAWI